MIQSVMMKIYVYDNDFGFSITTRKPLNLKNDPKEIEVPKEAAYLLLASQNGVDALQDALRRIYTADDNHFLHWQENQGENDNGYHLNTNEVEEAQIKKRN